MGSSFGGRVVFDTVASSPRLDLQYRNYAENNQTSISPLLAVPTVGLFSSFPPEYQHAVYLGVVRRLCHFYFCKVKDFHLSCRLSAGQLSEVSHIITDYKPYFPREFQRKFRDIKELPHFKVTEFRMPTLYMAPVLLKNFTQTLLHEPVVAAF